MFNSVQSNSYIQDISSKFGTVAQKTFEKGEVVFVMEGKTQSNSSIHTIQTGKVEHTIPNLGKYINHSCEPNCYYDHKTKQVIATQHISKGCRLSLNYNITEFCLNKPFVCKCGSIHCYGTISGYKYLNAKQKQRIECYIPEYFKK